MAILAVMGLPVLLDADQARALASTLSSAAEFLTSCGELESIAPCAPAEGEAGQPGEA